ncbi:MAG: YhdH/YhfP family quinone oxidoreductase [Deltaproteobacteria bacterium]|nr:YhdH/YhfP family quinone oxidoreductase [Deltaproteobacteria bacterium]
MPLPQNFKAMVVRETADKKFVREITQKSLSELPKGDLLIEVKYSSLNYKDALSATGNKGVTRNYPHTPGIDAAGVVVESAKEKFAVGEEVIVFGYDLGMNTAGGFGQYIRVPSSWAIKRPGKLTLKESMAYGTAGFTAALSVWEMERFGLNPNQGEVLVTGATGGVGCFAVGILAKAGYSVVAATGKTAEKDFLTRLGAKEVIPREEVNDTSARPVLKGRWAGVVDAVGGNILATAIKSSRYGGLVSCCGLVASPDLPTTVYPFILRGVSLLGIDSVECAMETRLLIWNKISEEWKLDGLNEYFSEGSLEELDGRIDLILEGKLKGRFVVNLGL